MAEKLNMKEALQSFNYDANETADHHEKIEASILITVAGDIIGYHDTDTNIVMYCGSLLM